MLGNLLAWQSPGYESLIVARILTGLAHGVFFSIGSTIATLLVPKEKAASAIAFTYLAPILQEVSGFGAGALGLVMLVYGVSVAVGKLWGGKLADRRGPGQALKIIFLLLSAVLLALTFTAPHPCLVLATVLLWGAVAFGNVDGLQVHVVRQPDRRAHGAGAHRLDRRAGGAGRLRPDGAERPPRPR